MKPTLLVLAAGMGTRYGGNKQLDEVGPSGETIIDYSIYDAIRAGFGKIVFVIRHDIEEQVKERFVDKLNGKIEVDSNAAWRLVWALNTLKGPDEKIRIPGWYDDIVPPTARDRELFDAQPDAAEEYKH